MIVGSQPDGNFTVVEQAHTGVLWTVYRPRHRVQIRGGHRPDSWYFARSGTLAMRPQSARYPTRERAIAAADASVADLTY